MYKPEIESLYHYQSIELTASSPAMFEKRGLKITDDIYLDKYKLEPLLGRKAYYSTLSDYNDPFEGNFGLEASKNDAEQFLNLFRGLQPNKLATFSTNVHDAINLPFSEKHIIEAFLKKPKLLSQETIQSLKNSIGFYCLTPNPRDMTMWAHYGDNHKGIVLEFEREPNSPCGDLAFEVEYFDSPPLVRFSELFEDLQKVQFGMSNQEKGKVIAQSSLKKLMFSKTKVWKHEKEWRTSNGIGINDMPGKLKSITFGLNTKSAVRSYLENCVELSDVEFKYIIKCKDSYSLKVVDKRGLQENYWLSAIC